MSKQTDHAGNIYTSIYKGENATNVAFGNHQRSYDSGFSDCHTALLKYLETNKLAILPEYLKDADANADAALDNSYRRWHAEGRAEGFLDGLRKAEGDRKGNTTFLITVGFACGFIAGFLATIFL